MNDGIPPKNEGVIGLMDLPSELIANHIFPFVGAGRYRFVAGVSREFKKLYRGVFRSTTTRIDSTTLKHVRISWEEYSMFNQVKIWFKYKTWYYYIRADDPHHSDLSLLQWAQSTLGCPWTFLDLSGSPEGPVRALAIDNRNTCAWAALKGDLDVLQLARAHGCFWDKRVCEHAAENGHLAMLVWAHENGCPWDAITCRKAAYGGCLEVLRYAHENGCPWDAYVCSLAAHRGHLDILQYAHANGCPWNEYTCRYAAENGHLEVLQYARANGCSWDIETCRSAAAWGHWKLVQWAHEHGCPIDADTYQKMMEHKATTTNPVV